MGDQATEGALGSRGSTEGGQEAFRGAILPYHPRAPPQLSSPGPAPGPSTHLTLGTYQPPVQEAGHAPAAVTAPPTEWGRDDRWWRCRFNWKLRLLGKGRRGPRTGGRET